MVPTVRCQLEAELKQLYGANWKMNRSNRTEVTDDTNGNWEMNSKSGYRQRQQQLEDESKQLYGANCTAPTGSGIQTMLGDEGNGNGMNCSNGTAPTGSRIQTVLRDEGNGNGKN
jgi:hypothetical protein